jgi:hypothetical protein
MESTSKKRKQIITFVNPRESELQSRYRAVRLRHETNIKDDGNHDHHMQIFNEQKEIMDEIELIMDESDKCSTETIEPFETVSFQEPPNIVELDFVVKKLRARLDIFQYIVDQMVTGMGPYGQRFNANKEQLIKRLKTRIGDFFTSKNAEPPPIVRQTDAAILSVFSDMVDTFEYADDICESLKMLTWSVARVRKPVADAVTDVTVAKLSASESQPAAEEDARTAAASIRRAIKYIDHVNLCIHNTRERIDTIPVS